MYQLTAQHHIKPGAYEQLVLCCQLVYTCPTFVAPLYIHELAQFPIIVFGIHIHSVCQQFHSVTIIPFHQLVNKPNGSQQPY